MSIPIPLTELDAVNEILAAMGEMPVATVDDTDPVSEAGQALLRLRSTLRMVCERGLLFNTEDNYEIAQDVDGNIFVPANCARINLDPNTCQWNVKAQQRGTPPNAKMYNLTDHTYDWSAYDPRWVVSWYFSFDECPPQVREYITVKAGRETVQFIMGDETRVRWSQQDEMMAEGRMLDFESDATNPTIFDAYDLRWAVSRTPRYFNRP